VGERLPQKGETFRKEGGKLINEGETLRQVGERLIKEGEVFRRKGASLVLKGAEGGSTPEPQLRLVLRPVEVLDQLPRPSRPCLFLLSRLTEEAERCERMLVYLLALEDPNHLARQLFHDPRFAAL
jgi:hypothetical protein